MKIIKLEENKINHTLDVEVQPDQKDWKSMVNKAYNNFKKNFTIPGFRKGHAPDAIVRQHINPRQIFTQDLINNVNNLTYSQLIHSDEIKNKNIIEDSYNAEVLNINEENITFLYKFSLCPAVQIFDYNNLNIDYQEPKVSDIEIENQIQMILNKRKNHNSDKEANIVQDKDTVEINFHGTVENKEFTGSTAKNYKLTIGNGDFIPGFEEQLINHKKGDKFTITLTLPEEYNELANKEAKFEVEILNITSSSNTELTPDIIRTFGFPNVNTLDELKQYFKKTILEQKTKAEYERIKNIIVNKIVDEVELDYYPENILNSQINWFNQSYTQVAQQSGLTLDQYIEKEQIFKTKAKFDELIKEQSMKNMKLMFAIDKIANELKVSVSPDQIDDEVCSMAIKNKVSPDQMWEIIRRNDSLDQVKGNLLQEAVFNKLIEKLIQKK